MGEKHESHNRQLLHILKKTLYDVVLNTLIHVKKILCNSLLSLCSQLFVIVLLECG